MADAPPRTMSAPELVAAPLLQPFGKYVLVRKLAEGGMAEIFLAKQVGVDNFEKNVVIKRMLASLSQVAEFVDMFRDEARLAAQLAHPNVVQILELGFEQGSYFIAMEYLAGEDLSTLLRRSARLGTFPPMEIVARIIADAARGLHYAHELTDPAGQPLGLVHRDISPSNLFLTYTGQVKVLDFGIARAATRVSRTAVGMVKGKSQYMSPEQATAEAIDRRSDVYSLGVSLYEALAARRPFARDTDLSILKAVVSNDYVPLRDVRPEVPESLALIVRAAMQLTADARYQTADAYADALDSWLAALPAPPSARDVSTWVRTLCGEERVVERTRVPTLAELRGLAAPSSPTAPTAATLATGASAAVPGSSEPATRANVVPVEVHVEVSDPARRSPPVAWRGPALTALAAGLAAVCTWAVMRAPKVDEGPGEKAHLAAAAVAPAPAVDAGALAGVAPRAPSAPATPSLDAGPVVAAVGPPPAKPPEPAPARPSPPKPVALTGALFSQVMRAHAGPVAGCFEQYRADLPSPSGTVPMTITVAASGKVSSVTSPLAATPVGQCLEARVKGIPFPAHAAKEASFSIPFAWSAKP